MNLLTKMLATFFFVGLIPAAPGTFGSLAGAALWWYLPDRAFLFFSIVTLLTAAAVCGRAEMLLGKKDDGRIVIDEVIGMFTAVAFLPKTLPVLVSGFIMFRLLDIKKPYPINAIQKLKGSAGVLADDIMAGVAVNLAIRIASAIVSV